MDWQPIESAPKDGTYLLAFWDSDGGMCVVKWCEPPVVGWSMPGINGLTPTHWQPLPEPPSSP